MWVHPKWFHSGFYSMGCTAWDYCNQVPLLLQILLCLGIETKYVVKLDLHVNLVHYYGLCSVQMRHSYAITAQFAVRNSVWDLISMCMSCFSPVNTYNCIKNAIILHRRYCNTFKIAAVLSTAHHSIVLSQ